MGFLFNESVAVEEAPRRQQTKTKKAERIDMQSGERGCDACPLQDQWPNISSPRMTIKGNRHGDILVLTEAPDELEDLQNDVLIGKTGEFLRQNLSFRHMDRIAFGSTVRCRPNGSRTPTGLEIHCCSQHLENDVELENYKAILLVGGVALSQFVPETSITQFHGIRFPLKIGSKVLWGFGIFHPSFVVRDGGNQSVQYPVFSADINRFFKEVDKWPKPTIPNIKPSDVLVSYDEAEVREIIGKMKGTLGFDIETSTLKPWMQGACIITASFSDGKTTVAFPVNHPLASNEWALPLILETTQKRSWVAHQAAFEFTWLVASARELGISWVSHRFEDTMAQMRLYHGRNNVLDLGLGTHIHLGVNVKSLTQVDPRHIMSFTVDEILPYNGLDAWGSAAINNKIVNSARINETDYERLLGAARSTAYMELAGLPVDFDMADQLETEWGELAKRKEAEAQTIYEVKTFVRERQKEFNIGNAEHVGTALVAYGKVDLPKTPKGKQYVTDDEVLLSFVDQNPLIRCVLDYRKATKFGSNYVKSVKNIKVINRDGDLALHPSYTTMHTATLRLSSTDPNIQNWPKRHDREIRRMIVAPPGHVIVACDSGQIQARIFGMASKDVALCRSFINKEDIHTKWLKRALEIYPDYYLRLIEATGTTWNGEGSHPKPWRDTIKTHFVFASFFGSTSKGCTERTGIPLYYTDQLIEEFWADFPDARRYVKDRRNEYRNTGGVKTLTGRFRYGVMSGNEPIITPIQGGEAEIMIACQNELSKMAIDMDDFYLHPRINVHDDLTFILPDNDDKLETYINTIRDVMLKVRYSWQIVPLTVEVQMGFNWCDLEKVAEFEGDYVH